MITIANNTFETNDLHKHQHLKLLINICALLSTIFAIIVSLVIVNYIILNMFRRNNLKKSTNIPLLLTCNTCFAIICSSSTLALMILSSIGGDLNISTLKQIISWGCYMRGYLHFVFINSIYLSYVLQAVFRLVRIAFHEYKCLRKIYAFSIYIIVQWIISFLLILPVFISYNNAPSLIIYLPKEFYCQVPMTSVRGIVFSILSVYFVPLCCIGIIYLWIILHIRGRNRQSRLIILSLQRKNKRDTIIIKRICVVMLVLLSLGIPSCLFVIVFLLSGHLHWSAYRVGWMTIAISFALISLSSIYVIPQIYKPIRLMVNHSKQSRRNRTSSTSTANNIDLQRKTKQFLLKQIVTNNEV